MPPPPSIAGLTSWRLAPIFVPLVLIATERAAFAQAPQPWCIPGTQFCAQGDGNGGVRVGGAAQGQAGPNGASANATGNASGNANAGGSYGGTGQEYNGGPPPRYTEPTPFAAGSTFCGTVKAGVFSGVKVGGCYALSFRWEPIFFEMETQLLFGGTRDTIDWLFPMSFVIPLTSQRSLFQGLQLRVGGTPFGVTFADEASGGNYVRFGLHAGVSYEWAFSGVAAWRVFDARAFLDFATKREIDDEGRFMDFGGQLATGIVF